MRLSVSLRESVPLLKALIDVAVMAILFVQDLPSKYERDVFLRNATLSVNGKLLGKDYYIGDKL